MAITEKPQRDEMAMIVPFVQATLRIVEQMSQAPCTKKSILNLKEPKFMGDILIEIDVIGDVRSRVFFDISNIFASRLAISMLGIDESEVDDDTIIAVAQEFGNMVSGNATGILEENNLACDITIPIVQPIGSLDLGYSFEQFRIIEFSSQFGDFNILIPIMKKQKSGMEWIYSYGIQKDLLVELGNFFIPKGFGVQNISLGKNGFSPLDTAIKSPFFIFHLDKQEPHIVEHIQKVYADFPQAFFIILSESVDTISSLFEFLPAGQKTLSLPFVDHYQMIVYLKNVLENIFRIPLFVSREPVVLEYKKHFDGNLLLALHIQDGSLVRVPVLSISLHHLILNISSFQDIAFSKRRRLRDKTLIFPNHQEITIPVIEILDIQDNEVKVGLKNLPDRVKKLLTQEIQSLLSSKVLRV